MFVSVHCICFIGDISKKERKKERKNGKKFSNFFLLQLHEFQIRRSKNAQTEKKIYDNSNSTHTGQCTDSHRGSAYIPFPHLWLCDAEALALLAY